MTWFSGWKLTGFLRADRKILGFSVGIGIDLIFVLVVETDLVLVSGHRN